MLEGRTRPESSLELGRGKSQDQSRTGDLEPSSGSCWSRNAGFAGWEEGYSPGPGASELDRRWESEREPEVQAGTERSQRRDQAEWASQPEADHRPEPLPATDERPGSSWCLALRAGGLGPRAAPRRGIRDAGASGPETERS